MFNTRIPPILLAFLSLSVSGCFYGEKNIVGTIVISPELKDQLKPDAVLYVIARSPVQGQEAGRKVPVAVRRFPQPIVFPVEFRLTPQDLMVPGTPFEGTFQVSARVAQTGSASPVLPGDLETETPIHLEVGNSGAPEIVLNRKVLK